jgi:hypothetical protein
MRCLLLWCTKYERIPDIQSVIKRSGGEDLMLTASRCGTVVPTSMTLRTANRAPDECGPACGSKKMTLGVDSRWRCRQANSPAEWFPSCWTDCNLSPVWQSRETRWMVAAAKIQFGTQASNCRALARHHLGQNEEIRGRHRPITMTRHSRAGLAWASPTSVVREQAAPTACRNGSTRPSSRTCSRLLARPCVDDIRRDGNKQTDN